MPDTVNGLPLHPLVVHAVVVLLPLASIGVIAIALHQPWRARYGGLVALTAALATAALPVATESGEHLARRVGEPENHAELGEGLIYFALPLLAIAAVLYWRGRRPRGGGPGRRESTGLNIALVALALAIAAGTLVQVYRVGDSGAEAVWKGEAAAPHATAADLPGAGLRPW